MGPESSKNDLPSRPRFSWDLRNVPWTDGKGNQEQYATAVSRWKKFHSLLDNDNSNKIKEELMGIMLQSQLYGRAVDLCRSIPEETIASKEGVDAIVNALYTRDPLAVVSEVYQDFITLLNTKRGHSESFRNFESRFHAQVSKFNSYGTEAKLSEALVAFMLLANSDVDQTQKISVLANCTSKEPNLGTNAKTNDYLKSIAYESMASIVRQCDRQKNSGSSSSQTISNNAAFASGNSANRSSPNGTRPRRTPEQIAALKKRTKCKGCGKYGHWVGDHRKDGSLKAGFKAYDTPQTDESEKKNVLTFSMVNLAASISPEHEAEEYELDLSDVWNGPLLDDGAPYSGIGMHELQLIKDLVHPDWDGTLEPIPKTIEDRAYWQYGKRQHASEAKRILGSVELTAQSDQGSDVNIRHVVVEGSTQWVVGKNVTKHCNILHMKQNSLELPSVTGNEGKETISLMNRDMHTYIPHSVFTSRSGSVSNELDKALFCAIAHFKKGSEERPWKEITSIIDRVHRHVCGHSNYTDIRLMLERNAIWSEAIDKYLQQKLENCSACRTTARPQPTRKVSLSSMTRGFNEVVCVDHMFLDNHCVAHVMDSTTRYSAGALVEDTSMEKAICAIDAHWITPFWVPDTILFDKAFDNDIFAKYVNNIGAESRPIPPRRHNKNVLESKHRIIRDVFLRLQADYGIEAEKWIPLMVQQSFRITNDLYGNDVMSSHELAKGYIRPIVVGQKPYFTPQELHEAHQTLLAKRKLTLILRSKPIQEFPMKVGDRVQVYVKQQNQKRGKWSDPKPILAFDIASRTVTLPGKKARKMRAAIEDIRPAPDTNELVTSVQDAIDDLDRGLAEAIEETQHEPNDCRAVQNHRQEQKTAEHKGKTQFNADFSEIGANPLHHDEVNPTPSIEQNSVTEPRVPTVGDHIDVYWPMDKTYYEAVIERHNRRTDNYSIKYCADGQREV